MEEKRRMPRQNLRILLLVWVVDMFTYYGTILLNRGAVYHTVELPLDALIPFVPAMIVIYVLAFVQWLGCYLLLGWEPPERCRFFALATIFAELICAACFLIYPTVMANRPVPEGTDVFSRLAAFIFAADNPSRNLLPSLHCVFSWICLRIALASPRVPRPLRAANAVLTALIFASVVLVKQHVVIDIPAGLVTAELGLLLARLCLRRHTA